MSRRWTLRIEEVWQTAVRTAVGLLVSGRVGKVHRVESLYALDVVPVQGDVLLVAAVERSHQRTSLVRVGEAEGVSQLVGGRHEEAGAPGSVDRPVLLVIEVDVASVHRMPSLSLND